ncbi:hypothetical protein ACLOJK_021901 [Asimina triloba]
MAGMAGAIVGMVASKLGNFLSSAGDVSRELENLSSEFKEIQAVLHDAECKQITDENVRQWLAKLKAVAYDMDDVLDESIIPALTSRSTGDGEDVGSSGNAVVKFMNTVCCHLGVVALRCWELSKNEGAEGGSFCRNVVSWYDVTQRVKEIKLRLDQIAKEKNNYGFREHYCSPQGGRSTVDDFETSSLVDESKIIGREVDKRNIISRLVSGTSQEDGGVDVFSIIGVGGMGKTTLARSISQDERVKQHFEKVLWVCVSDDFDVKRIIKAIMQDDRHHDTLPSELNPLQKKLLKTLQGKLFLLVLDDIWNEDEEKWQNLLLPLQRGAQGSKILITTRSEKIATMMNATYVCELKGLSDEDSWSLFSSKAFGKREVENQLRLEEIGKEIAKKCSGVPLSLKVMGSAMQSKKTIEDWQNIKESKIWALPEVKKGILPALVLSYNNLSGQLKQCFAYCSIFPKDSKIDKDKLVKMWLAQGFIQSQGRREIEDIAEEYFDELVARSMFQDRNTCKMFQERSTCKMHDLLHDLAEFITEDESRIFEIGKSDASCSMKVRHVAMIVGSHGMSGFPPLFSSVAEKLRTLLIYQSVKIDKVSASLFHRAKFLRVLHLGVGSLGIEQLPESIGELKHLSYLDVSRSHIQELPESLCLLSKLETLNLNRCYELLRLPRGMSRMKSLRHLDIPGEYSRLASLPKGLGKLTSLRTLSTFVFGGEEGCEFRELKHLNSLRGHLCIRKLGSVSSREEAEEAELWRKSHLRQLYLGGREEAGNTISNDDVLEGLRPSHSNLQVLMIRHYDGLKFPTWLDDLPFSNLVELRLRYCRNCKELPGLGMLPALKRLELRRVGARRVSSEFYCGKKCYDGDGGPSGSVAFPKLESLQFSCMKELEEWEWPMVTSTSEEMTTAMPSLHKLKSLPQCLPQLGELTMRWLPKLKVLPVGMLQLKELKCLVIRDLCNLTSWSDGLGQLKALEFLQMHDMPKLSSFPTGLGELKKLKHLHLRGLKELRYLPDLEFGKLEALESLIIADCCALASLPQGLQRLTNLGKLEVLRCPFLTERCERYAGEDWTKIAHIPQRKILEAKTHFYRGSRHGNSLNAHQSIPLFSPRGNYKIRNM